jgi:hypothetical protein
MKKILIVFISIFFSTNAFAINEFKYLEKKVPKQFCADILNEFDFPGFPENQQEPFKLMTELIVEDIDRVDGKRLEFNSLYTLYVHWIDPRVADVLKKFDAYEDTDVPAWLCDYEAKTVWGESRKLFDPVVEFYNRKSIPDLAKGGADWVEIFSNGTVQMRLRDAATFKAKFNFKKFPFDEQIFSFSIYPEFPTSKMVFVAEPIMEEYKKNLYVSEGEDGINIPEWEVTSVDYYVDKYEEGDYEYQGFVVEVGAKRLSNYYIFKIIIPILLILSISWSVFWIHPSQIESKVNITMVALLSLIAYNLIMDDVIPKLDYLTFMDAFIFLSYLYTGAATILCIYSYYRFKKYNLKINLVDYYAKIAGPISYFVSIIICSAIYL